jgi:hypothetical protein
VNIDFQRRDAERGEPERNTDSEEDPCFSGVISLLPFSLSLLPLHLCVDSFT